MESGLVRVNGWLAPLSWLYGVGVGLRNWLYDHDVLRSRQFPLPVIGVGNITAGGTGKTPHVEYIVNLLCRRHRVAVLSRGYKRKSRGYRLASLNTEMRMIGDEPWQMRQKFRKIYVAVDGNRVRGIERLTTDEKTRDVEVVLLDDAYQHRAVRPGLNILLVDYHRVITDDELLPAGMLREPASNMKRADVVVVTKCPRDIRPMGYRVIQKSLKPGAWQSLFFSTMAYGDMMGLWVDRTRTLASLREGESVMLLAGIGSPGQMLHDMQEYSSDITPLFFPDHHYFTAADVRRMNEAFAALPEPRVAITTEKDATRLLTTPGISPELTEALYVLPVKVEIMRGEGEKFDKLINDYVHKNKRNG